MNNVYIQNGFENRRDYLKSLAEEYDVPQNIVDQASDLLGENEDFDGLVTTIQDYSEGY